MEHILKKRAPGSKILCPTYPFADTERWEQNIPRTRMFDFPTIFWMGAYGHYYKLEWLYSTLCKLVEEHPSYSVITLGAEKNFPPQYIFYDKWFHSSYVNTDLFYDVLFSIVADVGLAPLVMEPLDLSRSYLKVIEYGLIGVAPIVSNIGSFKFLPDDVVMKIDDNSHFAEAIEYMVNNDDYRNSIVNNLRKFISEKHDGIKVAKEWVELFGSL
ncbi:MAG: hypothetical protein QXT63_02205 [Thermoplasmata archaeon]